MLWVAVFDTNILISALLKAEGKPSLCLQQAQQGKIETITCEEILEEFREKLRNKFHYSLEEAVDAAEVVKAYSRVVVIQNKLKVIASDPKDDKVLECAVEGNATHIVTGDRRHLQPLRSFEGIAIVGPAQFLNIVMA